MGRVSLSGGQRSTVNRCMEAVNILKIGSDIGLSGGGDNGPLLDRLVVLEERDIYVEVNREHVANTQ